jgi:hypothetical protein
MIGARIGGELDCSGVTITNPSGAALHGEHLQVAGNLSLRAASPPTVTVSWARYGWPRRRSAATWTALGPSSATPLAPRYGPGALRVAGRVFLREGFIAHGVGELGAVRLVGAHIGGDLSTKDTR